MMEKKFDAKPLVGLFLIALLVIIVIRGCGSDTVSNNKVTLTEASIIAQDFVKQKFFFKCNFKDLDIRGEEMNVPNRFNVLQSFTAKKDGVERQYVYKCILQFNGGEWSETSNWDFSTLTVEDVNTGRQWNYYGNL